MKIKHSTNWCWDFLQCWQVWFRVNEQLPANLQKSLPDRPPEMKSVDIHEGEDISKVYLLQKLILLSV